MYEYLRVFRHEEVMEVIPHSSFDDNVSMTKSTLTYQTSWEPGIAELIQRRLEDTGKDESRPFLTAIVGIPGSGKSVSSQLLAQELKQYGLHAMIMPHDGYHYTMKQLREFPDPADAIYRRGAPDTFDPKSLQRDLERIRTGNEATVLVPGFDHAVGDPEPNAHAFQREQHDVVICEGLYLLHNANGWEEISSLFDLSVFVHAGLDTCMNRLLIRNLAIPGYSPEQIRVRVQAVDRVNAQTVLQSQSRADKTVPSILLQD